MQQFSASNGCLIRELNRAIKWRRSEEKLIVDILVTAVTSGGCALFFKLVYINIENAKFWPVLANFGYFVATCCTIWRTFYRLISAVVYKDWQNSDMVSCQFFNTLYDHIFLYWQNQLSIRMGWLIYFRMIKWVWGSVVTVEMRLALCQTFWARLLSPALKTFCPTWMQIEFFM